MGQYLAHFGYLAVFFGVLLENAGVPVPGETILLAASALAAHGRMSVILVAAVAAAAAIVGDNAGFLIGRKGGRPLLDRWTRRLHAEDALVRLDRFFERFGAAAVFLARFVPGVRVLGALFAGASRSMPWRRFLVFNALGAVGWVTWIVALGYYGFVAIERLVGTSRAVQLVIAFVVLVPVGLIAWQWVRVRRHRDR